MTRPDPVCPSEAGRAMAESVATTMALLALRRLHLVHDHVGEELAFGDGTRATVYRETVADHHPAQPAVLVVRFRLRGVHGWGHEAFRRESVLHTPLFAGFPGFVSKLWLAADEHERYRGLYEWDGAAAAQHYARCLAPVLAVVAEPASIAYHVMPGLSRAEISPRLHCPRQLVAVDEERWWFPVLRRESEEAARARRRRRHPAEVAGL